MIRVQETQETYYRPGLIFLSRHGNLSIPIKDPVYHNYPDGTREQTRPDITAKFGEGSGNVLLGAEVTRDENGRALPRIEVFGMEQPYSFSGAYADLRGGVLILDEFVERLGLNDEERETAARKLLKCAADPKEPVTLWEPPAPKCPMDMEHEVYANLHPNRILALASEFSSKAGEFLAYERYTLNRPDVVAGLEKRLAQAAEEQAADEALSAV